MSTSTTSATHTQEISVNSGDFITVALEEKRNDLEEILIVRSGYTVQKKSEFSRSGG